LTRACGLAFSMPRAAAAVLGNWAVGAGGPVFSPSRSELNEVATCFQLSKINHDLTQSRTFADVTIKLADIRLSDTNVIVRRAAKL
jgi:hypothetical protein